MGNDVAIRENAPAMVRLSSEQLQYIAHTEFVPKSMRGNLPAILACVAMGRELGLGDMVSLRNIHVIDGRTALSAEVMVALVRSRGHSIQGNFSGESCTVAGKRIDNDDEITVTWTRQMAQDAGLVNKDNYKRYTPAMLWARGVSQLCRMLFADCFAGSTHTPEEITDGDYEDFQEIEDSAGEPQAVIDQSVSQEAALVSSEEARREPASPADAPSASAAQIKKLNVLVGTLREAGHITTEQVYRALGHEPVPGDDGEIHWSPLRESLSKEQASALIERLTALEAKVNEPSPFQAPASVGAHDD